MPHSAATIRNATPTGISSARPHAAAKDTSTIAR